MERSAPVSRLIIPSKASLALPSRISGVTICRSIDGSGQESHNVGDNHDVRITTKKRSEARKRQQKRRKIHILDLRVKQDIRWGGGITKTYFLSSHYTSGARVSRVPKEEPTVAVHTSNISVFVTIWLRWYSRFSRVSRVSRFSAPSEDPWTFDKVEQ